VLHGELAEYGEATRHALPHRDFERVEVVVGSELHAEALALLWIRTVGIEITGRGPRELMRVLVSSRMECSPSYPISTTVFLSGITCMLSPHFCT
jgi:hypothetical protein